ncbi:uncharacterized protein LOC109824839 [Asparagus officinalis]|uniref:uncharacterized protein LOC109824839 n=1 Tax=Asparagus officinalis TaxID=4686 RepID=UPI00098E1701|nr:uncharacterized protein LOC109824839 [Asparagus officinalis]
MGMIGRSPLTKCEVKFWIDLAKDEYGKGVSAEQRGLLNEAICHHENARRIFFELYPNHVSPLPSSSSCDPNERFRLTMDEWIGPSTERLDELYRRQADRDNELYEQRAGVQSFASLDKSPPSINIKQNGGGGGGGGGGGKGGDGSKQTVNIYVNGVKI